MKVMIELEEAKEMVLKATKPVEHEIISLVNAFQRVLAQDISAPMDMPPFDRSPLDGYAYQATGLEDMPLLLRVVSEIPAGTFSERRIMTGEAARIYTGAPIPPGANCVIRQEDTERDGDQIKIARPLMAGQNVVRRGEEIKEGELLLKQGFYLTPPAIGLLAAVGWDQITVYKRPRVGLLSTGSELMDVGQPLLPSKIYNSNNYTLRGMLQNAGCEVISIPIVSDQIEDTLAALEKMADTDMVISTGGASVGNFDIMRHALAQFGCEMFFWKVNLKPGTAASVGLKGQKLFFSLSGNPAAAAVTYELLVRPALRKLAGHSCFENKGILVKMANGFAKGGRQRRFLRARAVFKDGEVWADLASAQGSGVLRSMIGSQLLVDVPANHGPVNPGEILQANWIEAWEN
ncbi:molybdopterin molybdochelatase [Desulfosporosinus acidiphilus SJ4]|uniref:Molybdopterin molybdenumtransferase n=1 Tax=Desulfosporosinus acidiphilus (strain DSM 22704 / JCM 16185 / SJ4) TaxID=646529 RepID=I4DA44_DESAJ|nr:gephyrin-like molybdotransferase Glp [Desulfosporosinus acidiphilus]AFM42668.1 molybdopterin molybdochelatase [Desulfosporosinus acidiphilus SJ4]